jgi:hypothetical protein
MQSGRRVFAPRDNAPDPFDNASPDGVDPIVEVDGRVAVRDIELEAVADPGKISARASRDPAELVAVEVVDESGAILGLRRDGRVGGEGLDTGVDRHPAGMVVVDDRGEDRQAGLEVVEGRLIGAAADGPIFEIHERVGARLKLDLTGQSAVDVVGPGAGAGEKSGVEAVLEQGIASLDRMGERIEGDLLSRIETNDVSSEAEIGLDASNLE